MAEPDRPQRPDDNATPSPSPPPAKGWIDTLAQRSTGLPRESAGKPLNDAADGTSMWKWATLGLQLGGTVVLFLLIGRWMDNYFHWKFAATLTMIALALIGNFYLLLKEAMRLK